MTLIPSDSPATQDHRERAVPKCFLCDDPAVAMLRCTSGCTCLRNVYQARCFHHIVRLRDSDGLDSFETVELYSDDPIVKQYAGEPSEEACHG
jgi:hypothetical protein